MIGVPGSVAGQVLGQHGITLAQAREKTVELLTEAGVTGTHGRAASDALASIGIDVDEVRKRMDDAFGPGRFRYPRPVYSPRARKMLERTVQEATALGHDAIDTEHMLLGMIDDADSVGVRVLTGLGVDATALRPEILARAGTGQA
jgi:ATP-dependent Clp protease ATP-binding subunit ClpC